MGAAVARVRARRRDVAVLVVVLATLAALLAWAVPTAGPDGRQVAAPLGAQAVAATGTPVAAETPPARRRPNVVVFLVDDMRADELRWMPQTRRLLAERGLTYRQALSPHPLCCPARAGLLTGQYAQNNGVQHNKGLRGGYQSFDPRSTVATWLKRAGYRTGFVGKHLNRYERSGRLDPGWDRFLPLVGHTYEFVRFRFRGEAARNGYVTRAIQARTRRLVEEFAPGRRPFFVLADHLAPHGTNIGGVTGPPVPEERYATAYAGTRPPSFDDPAYDEADTSDKPGGLGQWGRVDDDETRREFLARIRSLASVDDAVGQTVATLRRLGELDDTVLVFTSDNGYALGEHRYHGKNLLSDEVLRVPLLVRGPGVPVGAVDDRHATLLDLTATIVDLADARPGLRLDGASLVPGWGAGSGGASWRDTTLVQTGEPAQRGDPASGWSWRGVLTERYSFGYDPQRPSVRFLYDRLVDPHELDNRAEHPAYAAVRVELARRTRLLGACAGADCRPTFGPLPEPVG